MESCELEREADLLAERARVNYPDLWSVSHVQAILCMTLTDIANDLRDFSLGEPN
jgi:hypothetical protein